MTPAASDPWPLPTWVAHRGAGRLAPENTLAAFRVGAALGWRAFECDVKLSRDGVAFLLHDDTLDRTSDGTGPAGELDWARLSRLDAGGWHGRLHAGEPPPTLDAVARWVRRNGHALNVEIKPTPGTEAATGEAVAAACERLWHGDSARPLLSSFKAEALRAAARAAPALPRALLIDKAHEGWLEAARGLGCLAVVANFRITDAALVGAARDAGLKVGCYTVDDAAEAQRLLALGVDTLITDAVDRFAPGKGQRAD